MRVTHGASSLSVAELTQSGAGAGAGAGDGAGDGAEGGELRLRLPAVAERHAGRYTCTLIDHRTGGMEKQEVELKVDSGE